MLGTLPFSLWIAKARGIDIQKVGSGNPGATNVARSAGLPWGVLALVFDIGKGVAAGFATLGLGAPLWLSGFAVLGHNWSVFLKFRGGKGVATTLGVLLVVSWMGALATMGVWAVLVALTRKVSVGSLIALMASPLILLLLNEDISVVILFGVLAIISVIRHRENIHRLIKSEELSPKQSNKEESSQ